MGLHAVVSGWSLWERERQNLGSAPLHTMGSLVGLARPMDLPSSLPQTRVAHHRMAVDQGMTPFNSASLEIPRAQTGYSGCVVESKIGPKKLKDLAPRVERTGSTAETICLVIPWVGEGSACHPLATSEGNSRSYTDPQPKGRLLMRCNMFEHFRKQEETPSSQHPCRGGRKQLES